MIDTGPQGTLTEFFRRRQNHDPRLIDLDADASLKEALTFLRRSVDYDVVIVDTRPVVSEDVVTAFRCSDAVLVPTRPAPADLDALGYTVFVCEEEKVPFRFVINAGRRTKLREYALLKMSKLGGICEPILSTRLSYELMFGDGMSPVERGGDKAAIAEIEGLFADVNEWISPMLGERLSHGA